jgi:drug/metabolite transporter (DMT)-like permease
VLVAAAFLINEKITLRKFLGIALGISGAVLLIIYGNEVTIGYGTFKGDSFILLNSMSYAIYLVLVKRLMIKYNPLLVVAWVFFFGLIFTIPFGYSELAQVQWSSMPAPAILSVIYVIIFATFLAYLLNTYALKTVSSTLVSYYIYVQPVICGFHCLLSWDRKTYLSAFDFVPDDFLRCLPGQQSTNRQTVKFHLPLVRKKVIRYMLYEMSVVYLMYRIINY